jgi:hypothetical protein
MRGRDRAGLNHLDQVLTMAIREPRGLAGRFAVDEAFRSVSVELKHPIAHDLQRHPADPRRLGARGALIDRRQRQEPSGLGSILGLPSKRTQVSRMEVRSEWDWHGEPPWFTMLNQILTALGIRTRVTPSETWYKPPQRPTPSGILRKRRVRYFSPQPLDIAKSLINLLS